MVGILGIGPADASLSWWGCKYERSCVKPSDSVSHLIDGVESSLFTR